MTAILFLHGFLGAPDQLASIAPAAIGVSLPGHGPDPWFPTATGFVGAVDAIAERIARDTRGAPLLVGYSMGARLALGVLGRHTHLAAGAVLVGADPGPLDDTARAARADVEAARRALLARVGLERFVDAWENEPIFATQVALDPEVRRAQRAARGAHTERGIAWVLEHLGAASQPFLDVGDLDPPITFLAGERDARFAAIAERLGREAPHGGAVIAPGCGHNLLLEAPDLVAREIRRLTSLLGTSAGEAPAINQGSTS